MGCGMLERTVTARVLLVYTTPVKRDYMTTPSQTRRGRPRRYAQYIELLNSLPEKMTKRPHYRDQIGLFKGERGTTVWIKIRLPGGKSREIKLGALSSWTWEQLEERRNLIQGRADRGERIDDNQPVGFATHAHGWLDRKKHTLRGFSTVKGHVRGHLLTAFGAKLLKEITTGDVNKWLANQRKTLKPATVARQFSTLNSILNDAVKTELIERNPTEKADRVSGIEPRSRFLDMGELKTVLAAASKIEAEDDAKAAQTPQQRRGWLRDFVLWAINSGMRRQEILNLRYSDIKTLTGGLTVIEIPTTKSGRPRSISASPAMLSIIERTRKLDRALLDDRVFPVSITTVKRKLTTLWKVCGLSDVRLHDLRRTHGSVLVKGGVDVRTVAHRLGHHDLKMLMTTYAVFLGDEDATKAADAAFSSL